MLIPFEVSILLEEVPEFLDRFLELVEAADGDPGPAAPFTEFADFVAGLLTGPEGRGNPAARGAVRRSLSGVERVARESHDCEELVGWAFLDSLCPEDLERLWPQLGPRTAAVAEEMGILPSGVLRDPTD